MTAAVRRRLASALVILLPAVLVPSCDFALFGLFPWLVGVFPASGMGVSRLVERALDPLGPAWVYRVVLHGVSVETELAWTNDLPVLSSLDL